MPLASVLISDITGSTQIYERETNQTAVEMIGPVLDRMRAIIADHGGLCVKMKGDDTVSYFPSPDQAFDAAWAMINEDWHFGMSVHAGIYFGEILHQEDGLYGIAVNTAARLSTIAKPGEILIGDNCVEALSEANREKIQPIGGLHLKGRDEPTQVWAASVPSLAATTVVAARSRTARNQAPAGDRAEITFSGRVWNLDEGECLTIGRSPDCDIVLNFAWVSRRHGEFVMRQGQLEYTDHSSAGSILENPDGTEMTIHRRSTMLGGSGVLIVGPRNTGGQVCAVQFVAQEVRERTT